MLEFCEFTVPSFVRRGMRDDVGECPTEGGNNARRDLGESGGVDVPRVSSAAAGLRARLGKTAESGGEMMSAVPARLTPRFSNEDTELECVSEPSFVRV